MKEKRLFVILVCFSVPVLPFIIICQIFWLHHRVCLAQNTYGDGYLSHADIHTLTHTHADKSLCLRSYSIYTKLIIDTEENWSAALKRGSFASSLLPNVWGAAVAHHRNKTNGKSMNGGEACRYLRPDQRLSWKQLWSLWNILAVSSSNQFQTPTSVLYFLFHFWSPVIYLRHTLVWNQNRTVRHQDPSRWRWTQNPPEVLKHLLTAALLSSCSDSFV